MRINEILIEQVVDVLQESTNELRLMLEQDQTLFESLDGWHEINSILDRIGGEQPQIGDVYAILSLTFTPPGKLLVIKGHKEPAELVKISKDSYTTYTFKTDSGFVKYPAEHDAGNISYRSFLFKSSVDLAKALTFATLGLDGWKINNHLHESLTEAAGDIAGRMSVGEYNLAVHIHLVDRETGRQIKDPNVNRENIVKALRKIPTAKAKIKQLGNGQRFWLHDNTTDISIGIRVSNWAERSFLVRTVIAGTPWNDRYPIFQVR